MQEAIWMGWTSRESGSSGFRQIHGDKGKAYGKYQFDYRYGLVPFMQYCVDTNEDHYKGFKSYIALGAANTAFIYNINLGVLWISYCDKYPEEFEALQDEAAYDQYYLVLKNYLKKNAIDISNVDPVVKGSLFSMAIRSGSVTAATKYITITNSKQYNDTKSLLKDLYATYGSQDNGRWTSLGQLGDALRALEDHSSISSGESSKNSSQSDLFRVGLDWVDGKCVSQIGAFSIKENAIKAAEEYPGDYKVYNSKGEKIYPVYDTLDGFKVYKQVASNKVEYMASYDTFQDALGDCVELASADEEDHVYNITNSKGEVVFTCEYKLESEDGWYRVGSKWENGKCIDQIGAYTILNNAIEAAIDHGMNVYDNKGILLYPLEEKELPKCPFLYRVQESTTIYNESTVVPVGVYTIVECKLQGNDVLGRLKSGLGWISLDL